MHTLVDCYVSRQSLSKFKIGSPPHQLTTSQQRHLHTLMSLLLPSFTSVSFERQFLLLSCSHHFAPGNKAWMQNCQASKLWQSLCDTTTTSSTGAVHCTGGGDKRQLLPSAWTLPVLRASPASAVVFQQCFLSFSNYTWMMDFFLSLDGESRWPKH